MKKHLTCLISALLCLALLAMVLWPVAFLLPYYFRATGRAGFTMAVALTAMAVFRLALAWLFVKVLHRNVLWIWYAMFADWVFRIAAYGPAFRRDEKRTRAGLDKPQQLG